MRNKPQHPPQQQLPLRLCRDARMPAMRRIEGSAENAQPQGGAKKNSDDPNGTRMVSLVTVFSRRRYGGDCRRAHESLLGEEGRGRLMVRLRSSFSCVCCSQTSEGSASFGSRSFFSRALAGWAFSAEASILRIGACERRGRGAAEAVVGAGVVACCASSDL